MTLNEKVEYINSLPADQRNDFVQNMSNEERNSFLKQMENQRPAGCDLRHDRRGKGVRRELLCGQRFR